MFFNSKKHLTKCDVFILKHVTFRLHFKRTMNRIKEILELKGIKQKWLAEKLGKSFNMVNSYVQNRRQPSLAVLYQIADILEIDVKELLISSEEKIKGDD